MANKFKAGMLNFIEVLNQMWDAFAAGPYNALPLTGGSLTGEVASNAVIYVGRLGQPFTSSALFSPYGAADPVSRQRKLVASLAVRGIPGIAYDGQWQVLTSSGPEISRQGYTLSFVATDEVTGFSGNTPLTLQGNGDASVDGSFSVGGSLRAGVANTEAQGVLKMAVANSANFFVSAGATGSSTGCALNITSNTVTGRGLNSSGTLNASGADYAEYMVKAAGCGTVAPGAIVGIDAEGRLIDKWSLAVSFAVKSSNPCMVGGDNWAEHLGTRPDTPERQDDFTDEQWADAQAAALVAQQEFDAALEQARQTVDRVAFAGQVPVNLQGATPGQYIVPVQVDAGIAGQAVDEADMTLVQYMRAIGRVIAVESDGRARIIVKVA
ncbi:hypothetical protein ASF61_16740 [Duganella sp. Leaf126]|uniref:hypothetical protein n=1 Tax=Duganella sp. Leaf126 TaxID=1736266 RepID=UPI0006F2BE2A|nr:hypothetical protein [Duganella sp. Leaf126]KQQ31982.1 hypothetical protein ASF61_16740 [Duganella sp. Leaf126]